jgi:hypothetical protein
MTHLPSTQDPLSQGKASGLLRVWESPKARSEVLRSVDGAGGALVARTVEDIVIRNFFRLSSVATGCYSEVRVYR